MGLFSNISRNVGGGPKKDYKSAVNPWFKQYRSYWHRGKVWFRNNFDPGSKAFQGEKIHFLTKRAEFGDTRTKKVLIGQNENKKLKEKITMGGNRLEIWVRSEFSGDPESGIKLFPPCVTWVSTYGNWSGENPKFSPFLWPSTHVGLGELKWLLICDLGWKTTPCKMKTCGTNSGITRS